MPRQYSTLTLAEAKRILSGAEATAESLGIAYNIAVVDAGGHLLAFSRQDGALIGTIDLAIDNASTARIFDKTRSYLATLAQFGKPLFGIQEGNDGKVANLWRRNSDYVWRKYHRSRRRQRRHGRAGYCRC